MVVSNNLFKGRSEMFKGLVILVYTRLYFHGIHVIKKKDKMRLETVIL